MTARLSTIVEQIPLRRPLHAQKLAADVDYLETAADEFYPCSPQTNPGAVNEF
jgi:hypothetical protein